MDYLFLLLANEEVHRLSNLPGNVRTKLFNTRKITEVALEHVADNLIEDYSQYIEAEEEPVEQIENTPELFEEEDEDE